VKRTIPIALLLALGPVAGVIFAAFLVLELLEPSFYYRWKQKRMVSRVMAANPEHLRRAARELLQSRPDFVGEISPSAPGLPSELRKLKPRRISVTTNSVSVDFGDVFNPFGIIVYAADSSPPAAPLFGRGPRQWIDGLFLYDDGQLETSGQQNGANVLQHPLRQ
jgi:hypothetical protein